MALFDQLIKPQTNTSNTAGKNFFSPVIQRQAAEQQSGIEKSCEPFFGDVKDLTWAAAKHFLDTEMPGLLQPVPVKFDCFNDKGLRGCTITLKNSDQIMVYFTEKFIHVQRPSKEGEGKIGYCKYSYSCDETGKVSFTEQSCVRTWNSR